jgi:hypothetical protein
MTVVSNVRDGSYRYISIDPDAYRRFRFSLINRPHVSKDCWEIVEIEIRGVFWDSEYVESTKLAIQAARNPKVVKLDD